MMQILGECVGIGTLALEIAILWRAARGRYLAQFPAFYSYVLYVFGSSVALYIVLQLRPQSYPSVYWFCFLISVLAEFAILLEISDHIFRPYPAIRTLGRGLTLIITFAFALFFIAPALLQARSSSMGFLDFSLRSSLTKAFIILALVAAVRHYRLGMSRNVRGLVLGFSIYLLVNVANFAAAQTYGRSAYTEVLWVMSPIAYALCLLIWTVAMWNYKPVLQSDGSIKGPRRRPQEELRVDLARFDNSLTKLLRK